MDHRFVFKEKVKSILVILRVVLLGVPAKMLDAQSNCQYLHSRNFEELFTWKEMGQVLAHNYPAQFRCP